MGILHADITAGEGVFTKILKGVLLEGFLDTLKIIPFLFLTYLIMEFIEHKASDKTRAFMERSGAFGPAVGGLVGIVPQCGFSAAAANFYTCRVITFGTLVAVFLSASDEMLPIMISEGVSAKAIFAILFYKAAVGIFVGFLVDIIMRIMRKNKEPISIDEICDNDGCHCENGIFRSALHHTLTVGAFVLVITLIINALVVFVGGERISEVTAGRPFISHFIASAVGLIPNCAVSVALTNLCLDGFISAGTMISGLLTGAGVGILVIFRVNKKLRENLIFAGILVLSGTVFGFFADLLNFSALL